MAELPKLSNKDMNILWNLKDKFPRQFYFNATQFLIDEMAEYIRQNQVWRVAIMGETRSGKSEAGQTVAFLYVKIFNQYLKHGFKLNNKKIDFKKRIKSKLPSNVIVDLLQFNSQTILASQSDYLYEMRDKTKDNSIKFGQIWQIDESREGGGLGSYSEKLELKNINNIIAKFCQCEIWIEPRKFTEANTPYGIRMYKKDILNLCNWGLLYKIDMTPTGVDFKFMGWVKLPLHKNQEHRDAYEDKKNKWISAEMEGNVDDRMRLRHVVAKELSDDESFRKPNQKGTNFKRNSRQQKAILERWIIEAKIQNFNETEKETIVEIARDLALEKYFDSD